MNILLNRAVPLIVFAVLAAPALAQGGVSVGKPILERRGGSITLKVPSYEEAKKKLKEIAASSGGRILDSETLVHQSGRKSGWISVSLPLDKLEAALSEARSLGTLYGENSSIQDFANQKKELLGRIERVKVHRARMLSMLNQGRRMRGSDMLYIQERIFNSELAEESMVRGVARLEQSAHTAGMNISFFEPATEMRVHSDSFKGHIAAAWDEGTKGLGKSIGSSLATLVNWLVYAPVWIPLLLLGIWGWKKYMKMLNIKEAQIKAS